MKKPIIAAAFAGLLALTGSATAQNFPSHPVTMVIPFAAGGPQDTIGRIIAQRMTELLGQTVVVENVGGAGGMTGAKRVADAKPDGYTMILGSVGTHAQNQTLYKRPLYNVLTDFTPVAYLAGDADRHHHAAGPAGEQFQGIHRLRQSQPGQDAISARPAPARPRIWPASCSTARWVPKSTTSPTKAPDRRCRT